MLDETEALPGGAVPLAVGAGVAVGVRHARPAAVAHEEEEGRAHVRRGAAQPHPHRDQSQSCKETRTLVSVNRRTCVEARHDSAAPCSAATETRTLVSVHTSLVSDSFNLQTIAWHYGLNKDIYSSKIF